MVIRHQPWVLSEDALAIKRWEKEVKIWLQFETMALDSLGMLQLHAADGQQWWYSDKCVSNTLTWQTVLDEDVTASDLHCPEPQGTFREILTDITTTSHKSTSDLPSPHYLKKT